MSEASPEQKLAVHRSIVAVCDWRFNRRQKERPEHRPERLLGFDVGAPIGDLSDPALLALQSLSTRNLVIITDEQMWAVGTERWLPPEASKPDVRYWDIELGSGESFYGYSRAKPLTEATFGLFQEAQAAMCLQGLASVLDFETDDTRLF